MDYLGNKLNIFDDDLEVLTYLNSRRQKLDIINILEKIDFFKEINKNDLISIASFSSLKQYKKNDIIFLENSSSEYFYIVISGVIAINKNIAGGRKRNLENLSSGEVFGELSLFDSNPRNADAEAIEDSEVIEIPNNKFLDLLQQNCNLANIIYKKIISILCQRLRKTDNLLKESVIWGFRVEA
jgi:CRP/FNR family transcriptional regulator